MTAPFSTMQQIPLDLHFRPAQGREDFLIASGNADAVSWIDRWPDWPAPVLVLEGPPGCGKTHLAHVWAARTGAGWCSKSHPDALAQSPEDLASLAEHLVLDPLDVWIGDRASETTIFHLYNILKESGRSALLTLRKPPSAFSFALPDLASRLRAAPLASIRPPDDALLGAVLVKLFADRQIPVNQDLLAYILSRMERSFAAARTLVAFADRLSLAHKKPVSMSLIREALLNAVQDQTEETPAVAPNDLGEDSCVESETPSL